MKDLPKYIDVKRTFESDRITGESRRESIVIPPAEYEDKPEFDKKIAARKAAYGKLPALPKTKNFRELRKRG